ncbi:tripartite tricarboxylate transporter substrate binding protein [Variovorax rhizosphaerae]|uniref:Tripartite tricarboxylate transporter substrate binding protein n=1 Tax=Variovorax rhizosphaerae TaxID=1836200 RepID=A0ABU8WT84_9BURK
MPAKFIQTESGASHAPGLSRRDLLALGGGLLLPALASAQAYPARVVRLMVGAPAGGGLDTYARIVAQPLAEALGNSVVVENKAGAGGVTNSAYVATSRPDGATVLYTTATPLIVAPQAMRKPPFDPLTDFVPVIRVGTTPLSFAVNPKLGVKNLNDLVALSKRRQISIASGSGTGGQLHLMIEALIQATGANILHVPYKGTAPSIVDTIAGHIDGCTSDVASFIPFHQEGTLTIIAVSSEKRLDVLPDVRAAVEDIPGFVMVSWQGIFVPAKTPKSVIDQLNAAMLKVLARTDVQAQFRKSAVDTSPMANPEAFPKFVSSEYQRWGKLLKDKGIVMD